MILAIHRHVDQMHNATMESVHVCPNTKEIHTKVVDLNVFSIRTVLETRHVFEANVSILVLEHVDKMLSARLSTTFRCVAVQMEWLEMHLFNADLNKLLQLQTHVILLHVDQTVNAEKSTDRQFAHV